MKLYQFPLAPNPAKVLIYLAEKGIQLDTEQVSLPQGEHRTAEFLARSPLGKVPVLELDDGSYLTESLAIIEYLEELHPEPPMIGTTPEERARVRSLERLCDLGVLASVARTVHATNSPLGLPPNPAVAEQANEYLQQVLAVLDDAIGDGPFVAGERVTIADCTLRGALRFGAFFGVEVDPAFANVVRWHERFQKRPSANPA